MLRLGHTVDGNEAVELSLEERCQGTYIIGTTGTGKSTCSGSKPLYLEPNFSVLTHI